MSTAADDAIKGGANVSGILLRTSMKFQRTRGRSQISMKANNVQ